jgi:hypothetical protein
MNLARFEPTIFCSVGGDDDYYYTMPPELGTMIFFIGVRNVE